jgi:hypothetical protein
VPWRFLFFDDEVKGLVRGTDLTKGVSAKKKMQYALDLDRLKELLTQIHGYQIAITLLTTSKVRYLFVSNIPA